MNGNCGSKDAGQTHRRPACLESSPWHGSLAGGTKAGHARDFYRAQLRTQLTNSPGTSGSQVRSLQWEVSETPDLKERRGLSNILASLLHFQVGVRKLGKWEVMSVTAELKLSPDASPRCPTLIPGWQTLSLSQNPSTQART